MIEFTPVIVWKVVFTFINEDGHLHITRYVVDSKLEQKVNAAQELMVYHITATEVDSTEGVKMFKQWHRLGNNEYSMTEYGIEQREVT